MITTVKTRQQLLDQVQSVPLVIVFWAISMIVMGGCDRYPHTNIYDPEVSGNKYEVILTIIAAPVEEFDCGNSERCFLVDPVIQNTGPYMADYVEATISENDPVVSIRSHPTLYFGQIVPGGTSLYHFQLAIPPGTTTPYLAEVFFEITEGSHGPWFDTLQVTLQ